MEEDKAYRNIRRETRLYARHMNKWWKNLQDESISGWAFLTAIGCWGIPDQLFQRTAFILSIIFFFGKLQKISRGSGKIFSKHEKEIENKILTLSLMQDRKGFLLKRLEKIKKFRKPRSVFKRTWRFIFGYTFLVLSCLEIFSSAINSALLYLKNIFV